MTIKESKASSHFTVLDMQGSYNRQIAALTEKDCSPEVLDSKQHMLTGECVLRGIPFKFGTEQAGNNILLLKKEPVELEIPSSVPNRYITFVHACDFNIPKPDEDGIYRPMMGNPKLGEEICKYILSYEEGVEFQVPVRRRFNINEFSIGWGNGSFECVPHMKPTSIHTSSDDFHSGRLQKNAWGQSQTRVHSSMGRSYPAIHWLYAMENPHPEKKLKSIRLVPGDSTVFVFGITLSDLPCNPLVWETRKKIRIDLPHEEEMDASCNYDYADIDLGQIISVAPITDYENEDWEKGYNNKEPLVSKSSVIIEYTSNPYACLYLGKDGDTVLQLNSSNDSIDIKYGALQVNEAERPVTIKTVDKKTGKPVPVKIHAHGSHGEYLAPVNRHRIPNPYWFEDYSPDFIHGRHFCTYIDGEAEFRFPLGEVYIEVSKGFEIKPIRKKFLIDKNTDSIIIELENILNWREKGWVTADTHVHFLSPHTALLEGEAEGVNVVNLLASQWGELFTNVGDFDGKTTLGSRDTGGSGEFLVRVGTENRQHILGHISLLGYENRMILPLTTGGPDESAHGDSVEETLSGWAERCRRQNGLSILPHFPNPRAEGAAALVLELIDGVEMTSWSDHYSGISPYSLSDWYRYLNCGYHVPAVGGTDKMSAITAVGTVRTYSLIKNAPFTYDTWKDSVKKGITFATYGPLLEFLVNGQDMGSRIEMSESGGSVDVDWHVASATIPVTKIELVVNGEIRESKTVEPSVTEHYGRWSVRLQNSGWIALRVRGCQPGKPEIITAHSSAVMIIAGGRKCFNMTDAVTILEQIEGATAFVKTLGTKAQQDVFNRIMQTLTSAHRALHNRMHQNGVLHEHTVADDHHKK